jgi:hypothetical protein
MIPKSYRKSIAPKIALLLLVLALPAVAQKPTIQIIPFTSAFVPAAAGCGFDVLFFPQAGRPNKERLIQFNNTAIIAGPLFVTVENLSTGKTIDLNISGSERFSFSGTTNTAVGTGPTILVLPANLATAAGLPVLSLIHGRFVLTLDEQGNITSITSVSGTVEDVCQLLQ